MPKKMKIKWEREGYRVPAGIKYFRYRYSGYKISPSRIRTGLAGSSQPYKVLSWALTDVNGTIAICHNLKSCMQIVELIING